jgi:uncharacterized coiled-coil protein SlyX
MKTVITCSLIAVFRTKSALILTALALGMLAFLQRSQAVSPPPDGGYAGGNTAEGQAALLNLTSGTFNTAVGFRSLSGLKEGKFNTALGAGTLLFNVADENTAAGAAALLSNTVGNFNTANGAFALFLNTEGTVNTGIGDRALFSNTIGGDNTANGATALFSNTVGSDNTANGATALLNNTVGNNNTADGAFALVNSISGHSNSAVGVNALSNNRSGSNNIAMGVFAGGNVVTGDNNVYIGSQGITDESNTIRIGDSQGQAFIAGIRGTTTTNANAIPVMVDSAGQLGTVSSSRRFKKQIEPMDKASEVLLALKPVTFRYKNDKSGTPQFGLIAEEVAEADPNLVVRDDQGEIYTVRYEAVNAMLLNEFLKQHRKAQEQEASIGELKSTVARQEASMAQQQKRMEVLMDVLKQQEAQIQNVSTQIEIAKPAPQVVLNNP